MWKLMPKNNKQKTHQCFKTKKKIIKKITQGQVDMKKEPSKSRK